MNNSAGDRAGLRFIGSAKISENKRVTLIEDVAAVLKAEPGDNVLFYLDDAGRVIIESAKRVKVN
jgi:hypothetical protein